MDLHGFNSREQGWFRSPEPLPAVNGIVVQPLRAATYVRLYRLAGLAGEVSGSDLDSRRGDQDAALIVVDDILLM